MSAPVAVIILISCCNIKYPASSSSCSNKRRLLPRTACTDWSFIQRAQPGWLGRFYEVGKNILTITSVFGVCDSVSEPKEGGAQIRGAWSPWWLNVVWWCRNIFGSSPSFTPRILRWLLNFLKIWGHLSWTIAHFLKGNHKFNTLKVAWHFLFWFMFIHKRIVLCKVINGFCLVQYFIYHSTFSLGNRYFAYCALEIRILFVFRRVCLVAKSAC
jgi:hypothetical protein